MGTAIKKNRTELEGDHTQRQLLSNCSRKRGMFAAQPNLRFYLFLPRVNVVLHIVREDLAKLGIDAGHVGSKGNNRRSEQDKRNGGGRHERALLIAFAGLCG